jgi:hypothetical protein
MAGNSDVDINVRVNAAEAAAGFKYAQTLASTFSTEVVSKFASVVGAAAVAKGAFDAVTSSMAANASMAKQVGGLASKFKIDPREVHSLLLAANDAGVSVRQLMMGMKSLGAQASKALLSKENAMVFKNLGADLDNLSSLANKPAAGFAEMAKLLMEIGNEQDRAAYGAKLFGRQYQQLLPLIEKVGKSEEARRKFLANENAMSNKEIANLREAARVQSEMKEQWDKIVAALTGAVLVVTSFVSMIFKAIKGTQGLHDEWRKVNAEWKVYDSTQKEEKRKKYDDEVAQYKSDLEELNVQRSKGSSGAISPELRKRIEDFERGKVVAGTGTFGGQNEGKSGFMFVDDGNGGQKAVPIDPSKGQAIGGGVPVWRGEYATQAQSGVLPGLAADGITVVTAQIQRDLDARTEEIAKLEQKWRGKSGGVMQGLIDLKENKPTLDFHPAHLQGYWRDQTKPRYSNRYKNDEEFEDAKRYRELTAGMTKLTARGMRDKDGKPLNLEAFWARGDSAGGSFSGGDRRGEPGMIPHLREQLEELKARGTLLTKIKGDADRKANNDIFVGSQLNSILQMSINARGLGDTHYVENGQIKLGKKPEGQSNKQVEDVDAPQKAKKAKQEARALRKKKNSRLMETEELEGYLYRAKTAEEEKVLWREEELDPKKQMLDAVEAALKVAKDEAEKNKNWKWVRPGNEHLLDTLTPEEDKAGTDDDGKVIAGSEKEKFLKWKAATELVDSLKTQAEASKKDYDAALSTDIENENAATKARIALQQKDIEFLREREGREMDLDRTRHERKLKYMEMEGKTQKEIAEESFKFELATLQKYHEQYEDLKWQAMGEDSMGGTTITKEEQDILDSARKMVEDQAGKAEGAMLKAAKTPGWQIMSDMRSIGGGGKILGTSANTAVAQLEELKRHSPLLQSMDASLKRMLGVDAPVKTTPSKETAVYAPSKGTVPAKPAPSPFYRDASGNVQSMNVEDNPSSDYQITEDYES